MSLKCHRICSMPFPPFFSSSPQSYPHRICNCSATATSNASLKHSQRSLSMAEKAFSETRAKETPHFQENEITEEEWRGWGPDSSIPAMVHKIVRDLNLLEREIEIKLSFNVPRGKLKGEGKIQEEKKHRSAYKNLDSEQKFQFFIARQVAYRLLGSRGYLCQDCWLPISDCMCAEHIQHSLWQGIHFWVYMHPKDFLRKNNTGKLLWQVFGKKAAHLCIFGIQEHEEAMWNSFREAGRDKVWCLYPDGNSTAHCAADINITKYSTYISNDELLIKDGHAPINFILVDGTWRNSRAMFSRLKEYAFQTWGEGGLPCIAFSQAYLSAMHRLRPQPSLDRTCTAAAAIHLLHDLSSVAELNSKNLEQSARALENSLTLLLQALSDRRKRHGKPTVREARWKENI